MQDDAYIFFRYAENLANGFGPVFNRGGPRVEGFTSPIWTILLALGARLAGGDGIPALATLLGLASYTGCLVILLLCARGATRPTLSEAIIATLLPPALWGLSRGAVFYSVTGLETDLFVLVVLLFHGALAGALPVWVGVAAAAVAPWVRPEGPWLAVAGAVQLLLLNDRRGNVGLYFRLVLALTAGMLLLLVTRWHYFHDILPNTYYAKRAGPGAGWRYLRECATSTSVVAICFGGGLGAIFGTRRERTWLTVAAAWVAATLLEGGDWMPNARFLQPALALCALAAGGLGTGLAGGRGRAVVTVCGCLLLLVPGARGALSLRDYARGHFAYYGAEGAAFEKWVKGTRIRSLATLDIGEIGFVLPDVSILDLDGLTDSRLAHIPGGELNKPLDLRYVFEERRPEMIVIRLGKLPETDAQGEPQIRSIDATSLPEGMLAGDPQLTRDYRLVFVQTPVALRESLYARAIYVRRDVQLPPEAVPSLKMGFLRDVTDRNADNTGNGLPQ